MEEVRTERNPGVGKSSKAGVKISSHTPVVVLTVRRCAFIIRVFYRENNLGAV